MINPLFIADWQTISAIKARTGHRPDVILRAAFVALDAKLIDLRIAKVAVPGILEFRAKPEATC